MDPRHDLRAKIKRNREARIAERKESAAEKFDPLLQEQVQAQDNLVVALRLMGEDVVTNDPLLALVRAHVDHGFPVPATVEARAKRRIEKGPSVIGGDERETVYELLRVATMGLRGRDRSFAYSLLMTYEQGEWSDSQLCWARRCLDLARNGARKVI